MNPVAEKVMSGDVTSPLAETLKDEDADSMDDDWEAEQGVGDPAADDDGDLLENLDEFNYETDPTDEDTDRARGVPGPTGG